LFQATAMGRLGFGGKPNYAGTRDPYYKGKSKNDIRDIKTQKDLKDTLNNLQANSSLVLAQEENSIKAVLLAKNCTYHSAGTFALSSPYLKISQASLKAFIGFTCTCSRFVSTTAGTTLAWNYNIPPRNLRPSEQCTRLTSR
jgi:hypothetical protein